VRSLEIRKRIENSTLGRWGRQDSNLEMLGLPTDNKISLCS
jgi:hypothetical protein